MKRLMRMMMDSLLEKVKTMLKVWETLLLTKRAEIVEVLPLIEKQDTSSLSKMNKRKRMMTSLSD